MTVIAGASEAYHGGDEHLFVRVEAKYRVTNAPGLHTIGLPVLRRRKSSVICDAEGDVCGLSQHLATSKSHRLEVTRLRPRNALMASFD